MLSVLNIGAQVSGILALLSIPIAFLAWRATEKQIKLQAPVDPAVAEEAIPHENINWRCGVYDYPPLSRIVSRRPLKAEGPLIYLLEETLKIIGKSPELFSFGYPKFYDGDLPDAVIGMFKTDQRAEKMVFSDPIYKIGLQGICKRSLRADVLSGIRDGDLKAVVYEGEVGWEYAKTFLMEAIDDERVLIVSHGHQMDTTTHLRGEYDVVLMDALSCVNFIRIAGNDREFKLAFPNPIELYYACLALNKKHASLLNQVNTALAMVRNSPEFLDMEAASIDAYRKVISQGKLKPKPKH